MMFRQKYVSLIGVALIAVGLWTFPADAQHRAGFRGPRRIAGDTSMSFPLLLRGANLTADQKSQVRQIMANHRDTLRNLFGQLRAARQDMSNKLFSTGGIQESDLASDIQQISLLRKQLTEEGLKVMLEIRGVLTSAQLANAAQRYQQLQALRAQMRNLLGQKEEPQ